MALVALLSETVPGLTDGEYSAAKDDLVAEGLLGKGRGRGGPAFLHGFEDDEEVDDDDSALTAQGPAATPPKAASGKKKVARKGGRG